MRPNAARRTPDRRPDFDALGSEALHRQADRTGHHLFQLTTDFRAGGNFCAGCVVDSRRVSTSARIAGLLMHIAQVAPLTEAIPPKLYGGVTESPLA